MMLLRRGGDDDGDDGDGDEDAEGEREGKENISAEAVTGSGAIISSGSVERVGSGVKSKDGVICCAVQRFSKTDATTTSRTMSDDIFILFVCVNE